MAVIAAVVVWILIGAVVALVMVRQGHSPLIWAGLVLYGPVAILLAIRAREAESDRPAVEVRQPGRPAGGEVDIVVGIDGSRDADEALDRAVELLGGRVGRVALARVVDYDVTQLPGSSRPIDDAGADLDASAARLRQRHGLEAETVVLTGTPADRLVEYARERRAGLLAVGSRGQGLSRVLLGRTASRVAQGEIPVLVVHHAREAGHPDEGSAPEPVAD